MHSNPQHHPFIQAILPLALLSALTLRGLEVGFLLLLDGLCVVVGRALVHGQCRDLLVGLAAVVAVVRLAWCVDHVVFVQAGVLGKTLLAAGHSAHVRLLTCGNKSKVSEGQKQKSIFAANESRDLD